jgi:TusA-related sulfurtransferase
MRSLDLRGEDCPGPLVKTIRELAKMRKGEKVVVLTTSKLCVELLKQTVESLEIAKIEVHSRENFYEVYLEKIAEEMKI